MQGVLRAAAWANTVGDVADIRRVDRRQPPRHGLGHAGVLQGRKPSRSQRAVACGEQAAHHRWRTGRSLDALFVSCRQACCQVGRGRLPWDPVHPRGPVRGETPQRPFPHRPIPVMGARGARHVGRRRCLRGEPFPSPRDGRRARRLWPLSCLGSARTPGFPCAAPGPLDGVGSLACRPLCFPRARLPRLVVPGGVLGRVCCGTRCCHRSDAPRRRPHAPPECLRVPACPSVPVVPALCALDRPGGAAGLAGGSCGPAGGSPRRVRRRTAPRCARQEADEALTRSRGLPCPACSGLRPRWPLPCLAESDSAETACPRRDTVRGSHTLGAGILGWFSRAGPRRSHHFRGAIPTLLTCSTRLLTLVSSRQRVSLPGWWLACARGRIFTSWIPSTGFIEEALLESPQ